MLRRFITASDAQGVAPNQSGLRGLVELLKEANPREVTLETAFQYLSSYQPQLIDGRFKGAFCKRLLEHDRESLVNFNVFKIRRAICRLANHYLPYLSARNARENYALIYHIPLHGATAQAVLLASEEIDQILESYGGDIVRAIKPDFNATFSDTGLAYKLEALHLLLSNAQQFIYTDQLTDETKPTDYLVNNQAAIFSKTNYPQSTVYRTYDHIAYLVTKMLKSLNKLNMTILLDDDRSSGIMKILCSVITIISDLIPPNPINEMSVIRGNYNFIRMRSGLAHLTAMDLIECTASHSRDIECLSSGSNAYLSPSEFITRLGAIYSNHVNPLDIFSYLTTLDEEGFIYNDDGKRKCN